MAVETRLDPKEKNNSTVMGAEQIIERAVKRGVDNIHIEPVARCVLIRYRQNGSLYIVGKLPNSSLPKLVGYFKRRAHLHQKQTKSPQSGQYTDQFLRKSYTVSVSTLPVLDGEKITLRLTKSTTDRLSLPGLGLWGKSLAYIEQALTQPFGLITIACRQQQYVNQTVSTMLDLFNGSPRKVAFVSNQTVATIPGVKNLVAKPALGWSVSRYSLLTVKQGFEVVGISSLPDAAAARSVNEAAETNQLVMAGIPADSAVEGLIFLQRAVQIDTGLTSIRAITAQRFVRGLCQACREAYSPTKAEVAYLDKLFHLSDVRVMERLNELEKKALTSGLALGIDLSSSERGVHRLWRANPVGCAQCSRTGYDEQVGLFEVCIPDESLLEMSAEHGSFESMQKKAGAAGMISLPYDGLIKALRGMIDMAGLKQACLEYSGLFHHE